MNRLKTYLTPLLALALIVPLGAAHADWSGGQGGSQLLVKPLKSRLAYDQYWNLKNPGGPVEINPQPLPPKVPFWTGSSTAAKVGFNPQPDPPAWQ